MKTNILILILQRNSYVSEQVTESRSVYARFYEPLKYLKSQYNIDYEIINENNIEEIPHRFTHTFFSKHMTDHGVKLLSSAKKQNIRTIFDVDDYIFEFPEYSLGRKNVSKNSQDNLRYMLSNCDIITTATSKIKDEFIKKTNIKKNVVLVRNGINLDHYYNESKKKTHKEFRLTITNADKFKIKYHFNNFADAVNSFIKGQKEAYLEVFADKNEQLNAFDRSRYRYMGTLGWDEHKYALNERDYSLGLVPLAGKEEPDNFLFNCCKSPIKYLVYGALKIPSIYSRAPIYEEVVRDKETGLLIDNEFDSWYETINLMYDSKKLRDTISSNAFDDIRDNHNIYQMVSDIMDIM